MKNPHGLTGRVSVCLHHSAAGLNGPAEILKWISKPSRDFDHNSRMWTIEHLTSVKKIMDIYFLNSGYTAEDELCCYLHNSVVLWYLLLLHSGQGKGQSQGWGDFVDADKH